MLVYFFKGELPWLNCELAEIMKKKEDIPIKELTSGMPEEFT